jgi:hypothetical protein
MHTTLTYLLTYLPNVERLFNSPQTLFSLVSHSERDFPLEQVIVLLCKQLQALKDSQDSFASVP